MLASSIVVNPSLYAYMALELGRTADDAPDAWCFLASTQFKWLEHRGWKPGEVRNMERWLHQRDQDADVLGGVVTFADGRVSQTPAPPTSNGSWYSRDDEPAYDWIARTAPRGIIGFTFDPEFALAPANPLVDGWIKLTLFDVAVGHVEVTQEHLNINDDSPLILGTASTTGDGQLKTFTFAFTGLQVERASPSPFDFEVRARTATGDPQPLVLSMVRVIKQPLLSPPSPPLVPGAALLTTHVTVVEMTAAGDISDYDDDATARLARQFAELAGVTSDDVEVHIRPASVVIVISIVVANAATASQVSSTVTTILSDASSASEWTGLPITSTPSAFAVTQTRELPPPKVDPRDGPTASTFLAIGIGSGIAFAAAAIVLWWMKRGRYRQASKKRAQLPMTVPSYEANTPMKKAPSSADLSQSSRSKTGMAPPVSQVTMRL